MTKLVVMMIVLISTAITYAQETKKMYKLRYMIEENDSLAKIYRRFVYPNSIITKRTPMTQKTIEGNSHVKNWNKPEAGTLIDVYIAYEYLDMKKYQAYLKQLQVNVKRAKELNETENSGPGFYPQGLKASVFYMASYGKFTQKDRNVGQAEFYQNSPITLGASLSYYPANSQWSFSSSLYAAYLLASSNNLDNSNVSVKPETGMTLYPEYRFKKYNFTGYFGIDYEQFSTFNMGGLQNQEKILLDQNAVLYGTIGFSKLVHLFRSPFFTKLSFSQSISSKNEPNSEGISTKEDYSGYKFLWYVNKKLNDKFYIHTLFKYHSMTGPSELTTLRLGVGMGYILF